MKNRKAAKRLEDSLKPPPTCRVEPAMKHAISEAPTQTLPLPGLPVNDSITPALHQLDAAGLLVPEPVVQRRLVSRFFGAIYSACGWLFGVASLIAGLAILAGIPLVQFLTLGYLLEVGGRVARTGRLRDGFVGVRKAARIGSIVLGTVMILSPLYLVSGLLVSAQLVDPGGTSAQRLGGLLNVMMIGTLLHIIGAWSRGGKLRHFLWPMGSPVQLVRRWRAGERMDVLGLIFLGNIWWLGRRLFLGGYYTGARDAVWDFVVSLRLPYYFWLGISGFLVGLVWLLLPVALIAAGRKAPIVGFIGGFLLIIAVMYVPFLQMQLARDGRLWSGFSLRGVRRDFCRAPVAFVFALLITLAFAFPLFFFKIEMIPRDGAWLMTPFFILSIWPARFITGWAVGRATHRAEPRFWLFRWTSRLMLVPIAAAYVLITYFSQFTSWYGIWSLYEQPAFLLPVPFLNF